MRFTFAKERNLSDEPALLPMKTYLASLILLAAAFHDGCSPERSDSSREMTVVEMPIANLESLASGFSEDGVPALEQVVRMQALGGSQRYMVVYQTDPRATAEKFVYVYGREFMELLKKKKATVDGMGTNADKEAETASSFQASFRRQGVGGFIDVFMYQRTDESYHVRVIFFEGR